MKSLTMQSWISRRGLQDLDLSPKLANLTLPEGMADREIVCDRLAEAIRREQNITIWADYDCDGLGAGIIMTEVLQKLGGRVTTLISSRFNGGGYGVNDKAVERILETNCQVLVTCDCGGSDGPRIKKLMEAGIDCLIIDHHIVPTEKLHCVGFLNPNRPDCKFPFNSLCSAGLALNVGAGMKARFPHIPIDLRYWLDVCAISTVADVVPLTSDNRVLVAAGLKQILKAERPGMRALLQIAKIDPSKSPPLTGRDIGFRLAPLLNAPGRLGSADVLLRLLMAPTFAEALEQASELQQIAIRRRELTLEIQEEAEKRIEAAGWQHAAGIVMGDERFGHGIVGITAGRLVDKYKVPCVVFGSEGKGSVRGPAGSKLHTALTLCQEYLVRFGGHQAAAGCEISWPKLDQFREAWCKAILETSKGEPFIPDDISLKIDPKDTLRSILSDLEKLEPCGQGNPRPQFVVEGKIVTSKEVKGGHLSLEMRLPGGSRLKGFRVGEGSKANSLLGQKAVWKGDLRPTSFGREGVEMFVESVELA